MKEGDALASVAHRSAGHRRLISGDGGVLLEHEPTVVLVPLQGIHDLRTRTAGHKDFVQFHVWVDPGMTVGEAHRVMDEVEEKLSEAFPGVEILIHPDPAGRTADAQEGQT